MRSTDSARATRAAMARCSSTKARSGACLQEWVLQGACCRRLLADRPAWVGLEGILQQGVFALDERSVGCASWLSRQVL
jgi:hypothetical protein